MLRYWSSLRYSSLRTLFLLADELRRQSLGNTPPSLYCLTLPLPILYAEWQTTGGRGVTLDCAILIATYNGGHRLGLPMAVCVECLPADKPRDVVSVTRRSSGVGPRACVRVYALVLVPPNLYIHAYDPPCFHHRASIHMPSNSRITFLCVCVRVPFVYKPSANIVCVCVCPVTTGTKPSPTLIPSHFFLSLGEYSHGKQFYKRAVGLT